MADTAKRAARKASAGMVAGSVFLGNEGHAPQESGDEEKTVRTEPAQAARGAERTHPLCLLDLDQRAGEVLGVQEQDGLPWAPIFGLPSPSRRKPLALSWSRVAIMTHLVTEMVHAAVRVALEEFRDRRVRAQGVQQFNLGVGQLDEYDRHAMVGFGLGG